MCTKSRREGLAAIVQSVARECRDVRTVSLSPIRGCSGEKKVKIPDHWPVKRVPTTLSFVVFDGENGARDVLVTTRKPWAIRTRIRSQLKQRDITVC